MARGFRNCVVWRKVVEFRNYIYELAGRMRLEDSHIVIDMRNTVDILVFGIMMAYEYMDEESVLECLNNSRGKAARLSSLISPLVSGKYLTGLEMEEVQALIGGIVMNLDIMVEQVKSGKFFKDERDVFDELDEL